MEIHPDEIVKSKNNASELFCPSMRSEDPIYSSNCKESDFLIF